MAGDPQKAAAAACQPCEEDQQGINGSTAKAASREVCAVKEVRRSGCSCLGDIMSCGSQHGRAETMHPYRSLTQEELCCIHTESLEQREDGEALHVSQAILPYDLT